MMRTPLLTRRTFTGQSLALAAAGVAGCGGMPVSNEPLQLSLATSTAGGGLSKFGDTIAESVATVDPNLRIRTQFSGGSKENIALLERKAVDLGLVAGEEASEALLGLRGPASPVKIVAALYPSAGMFVVRADSPVRSFDDLRGKRILFGTEASGLAMLLEYVLLGLGMDPKKDVTDVRVARVSDAPGMVARREVDALWGGGIGWPAFEAVANAPGGARFIGPPPDRLQQVLSRYSFIKPLEVPAGSYRGLTAPIRSVGTWACMACRPDLPDAVAYRLAASLHRAEGELAKKEDRARFTTARNTPVAVAKPDMIHPAVRRYLATQGYL
jgi:TRAP transporter TAXI family solute receptor